MSVKDWSPSAGSNTNVGGIFIGENMARDDVNDGMRAQMAEIASFYQDEFLPAITFTPEQNGAVGDGVADDTTAIQAAVTAAAAVGGTVTFGNKVYKTTSAINVPANVTLRGTGYAFPTAGYNPAANRLTGSQIYKAHTGHGIVVTGTAAYDESAGIYGLTVTSNYSTYAAGDGFRIDQVGSYNIEHCSVWSCGGNGFTIGVTSGDVTGQIYLRRLYVNNCTGRAYNLRAKWVSIDTCVSDGCSHGLYLTDTPETVVFGKCHFEGFTTAGIKLAGACGSSKITGKTFVGATSTGPTGIQIDNVAGNGFVLIENVKFQGPSATTAITFTGTLTAATSGTLTANWSGTTGSYSVYFSDGSVKTATLTNGSTSVSWTGAVTATANAKAMSAVSSVAIDIAGTGAGYATIRGCEVNSWQTGVSNNASGTQVEDNSFYACGLPIYSNGNDSRYLENVFDTTTGNYEIDHVSGSSGRWEGNTFGSGKLIKPTAASSANGYYNGVHVSNNPNFKTRSYGSSSIATGTGTNHGLIAAPYLVTAVPYATGSTSSIANTAADATTFTLAWAGTTPLGINWQAVCRCELD